MNFNGYRNWETWALNLHLDDDLQSNMEDWMEELTGDDPVDTLACLKDTIKDWVEEYVYETMPERMQNTLMGDYVSGCLGEVDWYQIAEHHLTAYNEQKQES